MRFFMDHGMIHDRLTGQHIHTDSDIEPGAQERLLTLLQELDATREALLVLVELKRLKRYIEDGTATDATKRYYEANKEGAWRAAESVLQPAPGMFDHLNLGSCGAPSGDVHGK